MDCPSCQDRLIDFLTGDAPSLASDVSGHLEGCADCQTQYRELHAAYQKIGFSPEPVAVPVELRARVLSDVFAESPRAISSVERREPFYVGAFRLFVAGAVAAGIAVVVTHAVMTTRVRLLQKENQSMAALLEMSQRQSVEQQESLRQHDDSTRVLQAADMKFADLAPTAPNSPSARLFLDPAGDRGLLVVRGAKPTLPGRTNEVWLITGDQKKIRAGTFAVGPDGTASVPLAFEPSSAGAAVLAAVTEEPAGGVPQPTGSIAMAGKLR